jgi:FtsP/CotA-like multicopper oxidase with cupredoxin domain
MAWKSPLSKTALRGSARSRSRLAETFTYEFTVHQEGTFFYHAHGAMQEMIGQIGLLIAHPAIPYKPRVDHDFGIILQEWAVLPSNTVPNTANMEFNWLTFNGRSAPAITPMVVRQGSRVRIRIVNIGMDHHPSICTAINSS